MIHESGPLCRFCDELDALIFKWSDKPSDDCLTIAEIVGAIETVKIRQMLKAFRRVDSDDDTDDDDE